MFACFLCLFYAALLAWSPYTNALLLFLPLVMFVRMALNALDGMVAQVTNSQSAVGVVLNEVCDVIADMALFSGFIVLLAPTEAWWLLMVLSVLIEFLSLAIVQASGVRPHSGPFGKSDRAVYLGLLAILLLVFPAGLTSTPLWLTIYITIGLVLSVLTLWNRSQFIK